jgi:hypothetical protein
VRSGWESYGSAPPVSAAQRPAAERPASRTASPATADMTWGIGLGSFQGPGHADAAEQRKSELAAATGLGKGLWVSHEGWRSQLYYGRYRSPADAQALRDLETWRQLRRRGTASIPPALVMPTILTGGAPQHNLALVGPPGEYTLQIGHYDSQFGKDFRRAAEQAVAALRQEGVEAYYHHGPEGSSVTAGIFGADAVEGVVGPDGYARTRINDPRITELQNRFPAYFINGVEQVVTVRGPGGGGTPQKAPTTVARIPR